MGAKKPLELTPTPLEGDDEAEARYEQQGRRLELTTKSGSAHKEFSHETGTVRIDDTGVEEYRARAEAERCAHAAKLRENYEKETAKVNDLIFTDHKAQATEELVNIAFSWGGTLLLAIAASCSFWALYDLAGLIVGRPANDLVSMLVLVALSLAIYFSPMYFGPVATALKNSKDFASNRTVQLFRILARFAYAFFLIYFGIRGVMSLVSLWKNPPRQGVNWGASGLRLAGTALTVIALVYMVRWAPRLWRKRREVLAALDGGPPVSLILGLNNLNNANRRFTIYAIEASFILGVLLAVCFVLGGVDLLTLARILYYQPGYAFFFVYPVAVYLFFRNFYYPTE